MLEDQEMWTEQTGEDRARLKDFYNVEYRPLIEPDPATARTLVATNVPARLQCRSLDSAGI